MTRTVDRPVESLPGGENAVPPLRQVVDRVNAGDFQSAADRFDRYFEQCRLRFDSYHSGRWLHVGAWLREHGMSADALTRHEARILRVLSYRDGRPFRPASDWAAFEAEARQAIARVRDPGVPAGTKIAAIGSFRSAWKAIHDRMTDFVAGMLSLVAQEFGEEALGACMKELLSNTARAARPPTDTVVEMISGMRGHLTGKGRWGEIELVESDDAFRLTFEPCGSGGRQLLPDEDEGHAPRAAPNAFGVLRQAHDFTWNMTGICHYCTHCCIGMTIIPIERRGVPEIVVTPPRWDFETGAATTAKCTFTIYKDPLDAPESAYAEVGLDKTSELLRPH